MFLCKKAPRPLEKWEGVYNAIHEGNSCVQKSPMSRTIVGSEDCLYLNVYTPEVSFILSIMRHSLSIDTHFSYLRHLCQSKN